MELHIEDLEIKEQRIIGGCIFFTVDDQPFPCENWYDMVPVLLENWLPQILSFSRGHSDQCTLNFMDGPYTVKLLRASDGRFIASCLKNNQMLIPDVLFELPIFVRSVVKALRQYQRQLYTNGFPIPFVDMRNQLAQLLKELENIT